MTARIYVRVSRESQDLDAQARDLIAAAGPDASIYREKVSGTGRVPDGTEASKTWTVVAFAHPGKSRAVLYRQGICDYDLWAAICDGIAKGANLFSMEDFGLIVIAREFGTEDGSEIGVRTSRLMWRWGRKREALEFIQRAMAEGLPDTSKEDFVRPADDPETHEEET